MHATDTWHGKAWSCSNALDDIRSKVDAAQAAAENAKDDLDGIQADLDEKMGGFQEFRKKAVCLIGDS